MHQINQFELTTLTPVRLTLGAGCTIRVTHGRLWLTRPGHLEDVWLQAGEGWTLPTAGTVWLSAEPVAQFQVARAVTPWRWPGLAPLRSCLPSLSRRTSAAA